MKHINKKASPSLESQGFKAKIKPESVNIRNMKSLT